MQNYTFQLRESSATSVLLQSSTTSQINSGMKEKEAIKMLYYELTHEREERKYRWFFQGGRECWTSPSLLQLFLLCYEVQAPFIYVYVFVCQCIVTCLLYSKRRTERNISLSLSPLFFTLHPGLRYPHTVVCVFHYNITWTLECNITLRN